MSLNGGRPSQMSKSGRETLPYVRDWSGDHSGCLEWSENPPGCSGVVGRPSLNVP